MAVRGVYTSEEEKSLADFKKNSSELVGWINDSLGNGIAKVHRTASAETIENWGRAADYWNPLWWDDSYARNTRWGGIIAFPFFEYCLLAGGPQAPFRVPPEVGTPRTAAYSDSWDFYVPVRPGDTFKLWNGNQEIKDVTNLDGKSPRMFKKTGTLKYINQRDQVTAVYHHCGTSIIIPPGMTDEDFIFPAGNPEYHSDLAATIESKYTEEEIASIDRIADAEEIRGANPRYWEDVEAGDKLTPIVQGPLTLWDGIMNIHSFGLLKAPMRELFRKTPRGTALEPDTNIRLNTAMWRLEPRVAKGLGHYSTTLSEPFVNQFLGRLITNWMGDDGFILRFYHRKASNTPFGDTIVGTGKVIKKYRGETGTYLVDLTVEMETNRGNITNMAMATVSLPSRE